MASNASAAPQTLGYISTTGTTYTMLRVKRKRNQEPLDALVVDTPTRKKRRIPDVPLDVFQFAETVENETWDDQRRTEELQIRIRRLAAGPPPAFGESAPSTSSLAATRSLRPDPQRSKRRYTVKMRDGSKRLVAGKDEVKPVTGAPEITMYDAEPSVDPSSTPPPEDPEMAKFLPLLEDYLKLHDIKPEPEREPEPEPMDISPKKPSAPLPTRSSELSSSTSTSGSDYVWDVFYRRAATASDWDKIMNFGTLTGLPNSLNDPYASDTDSEPEDEDDEDSNAEDYYKNDYPDEEDSNSDGSDFYHSSDRSDLEEYYAEDYNDGHAWR